MNHLVITNARLASNPTTTTRSEHSLVDITIEGEIISAIGAAGSATSRPGGRSLNVGGMLLTASFAEPHAHLDKALAAERVDNPTGDLMGAITAWRGYAPRLTVDDIAERAERAALMLLASGTTLIRTHVDVNTALGLRAAEALLMVRERLAGRVDIELTALIGPPITGDAGAVHRELLNAALDLGIDHVGGCPHLDPDPHGSVDVFIDIAGAKGVSLDLHVDETLDASMLSLETLAERIVATGFGHRVMASHCVSLGMQPDAVQQRVSDKVAAAGISIVTLPQTNLYLQARGHMTAPPRGLTAIDSLLAAGVNVAAGADNVQDPFNLVGRGDPLETAALMVMAGHRLPDDAYEMVTTNSWQALGHRAPTVAVGSRADLVAIDAASIRGAIAQASPTRTVIHRGRVVASTRLTRET